MKKVLTVAMALVLALGLCTPAFAALPSAVGFDVDLIEQGCTMDDITLFMDNFASYAWQTDRDDNPKAAFYAGYPHPSDLEIYAGDKLYIQLMGDLFLDEDGSNLCYDLSMHELRTSQLSKLRLSLNKGKIGAYIESVELRDEYVYCNPDNIKTACAVITFVDDFVFVSEKDFEITLSVRIGGDTGKIPLSGKLTFDEETVEEKQDSAESAGGLVLKPLATIMNVPIDIGNGLTMTTHLIKDRKIYANAKVEWEKGVDPLFEELPELLWIYTVRTHNVIPGQAKIKIDFADPQAYVYDKDGKYLGTTKDELPFSERYFICEAQRDSIVPPITDAAGADPLQMTLEEYLAYLATGVLPQRLQTPAEETAEAPETETAEATA